LKVVGGQEIVSTRALHKAARNGIVAELEALLAGLSVEEAQRKIEERNASNWVSFSPYFFLVFFNFRR